jgi:hypothetical protein
MPVIRVVAALALGACAAAAWGGAPEAAAGRSPTSSRSRAVASADRSSKRVQPDSLRFELLMPSRVTGGEPVRITLQATNAGSEPLVLYLTGRVPAFDITITREDGGLVWRRLHGQTIPAILQVKTLQPGERLDFVEPWDQRDQGGARVAPGRYAAQGALLTDREPLLTAIVPFEITER